ncbi:MAG: DUF4153 domain-containing protein [Gemmatimonadaceae bacterium]
MSVRTATRSPALLTAMALGILGDALLSAPGRPGLNMTLWALAGVAALVLLSQRRSDPPARESQWFVIGALLFAITFMLRDSEALAAFSIFAGIVLLGMAAGRAATAWAARAQISDVAFSALRVGLLIAGGPLGWGRAAPRAASRASGWTTRGRTLLRGTLMALPALLVLGALLMSADPVFARVITDVFQIDLEPLIEHVGFASVIAWFSAGLLRAFLVPDDEIMDQLRVPQPALAAAEVSVALWILNLLFLAFMVVQLRYLFGGANLVEVTAGLSYAEYARRGFFELVATTALVVPILLLADWAVAPVESRSRSVLRTTMLVLVVLLLGVIASAAYRMKLYQDAYGLTEQRVTVSMIIVWLTAVLGWLVFTVLRGRHARFALGTIVAGLVCIAALHVLNPHALIARVNIDRAAAGKEYDGSYLRSLSADAVPVIVARLNRLPEAERCRAARMLEERWSGERRGGWRTWNLSDWRARRLVALPTLPPTCANSDAAPANGPAPVPQQ